MHLFVYGSLMFEPVWSRLTQGSHRQYPARLYGFTRRKVRDDVYPVVFASEDSDWVDGLVYLNISPEDIERLDHFEGEFYRRQEHMVFVKGHEPFVAAVYVLRGCYSHLIDSDEWDAEWFANEGLATFLGHYQGF